MAIIVGPAEALEASEASEVSERRRSLHRYRRRLRGRLIRPSPAIIPSTAGVVGDWADPQMFFASSNWPPAFPPGTPANTAWPNLIPAAPVETDFMRPVPNVGGPPMGFAMRQKAWGPDYYAQVVLSEFVRFAGAAGVNTWTNLLNVGFRAAAVSAINYAASMAQVNNVGLQALPLNSPADEDLALRWELRELAALVDARPSVMAEIMAQKDAVLQISGILGFNMRSHPATTYLAIAASRVAGFAAMHYKANFNRRRASSVMPGLLPPLEVPGHLSYPSGHATQAYLIAMCLEVVMPQDRVIPVLPGGPVGQLMPQYGPLRLMADRIARNREVAGLHYLSDTWACRILAAGCFRIMSTSIRSRRCGGGQ